MRDFVRPVAAVLGVAVAISLASNGAALAQASQQQMELGGVGEVGAEIDPGLQA